LEKAHFDGAILSASLAEANLSGVRFERTNLIGAFLASIFRELCGEDLGGRVRGCLEG
jgi:uncharacterized protein YjbI with pentapeptide repeats